MFHHGPMHGLAKHRNRDPESGRTAQRCLGAARKMIDSAKQTNSSRTFRTPCRRSENYRGADGVCQCRREESTACKRRVVKSCASKIRIRYARAYETYKKGCSDRRMIVPAKMVGETLDIAGEDGFLLRRRQQDVLCRELKKKFVL